MTLKPSILREPWGTIKECPLTMVSDNPQEQQNQEVHEASRRHMFGHCGELKVQGSREHVSACNYRHVKNILATI